jgi:5-methylcytosine-specific restriction enzyme A
MREYKTAEQKRRFYKSRAWRDLRLVALERDCFECQECKAQGRVTVIDDRLNKLKQLDVDHVKEIEDFPELALDLENLRTLCIPCHNNKHGRTFTRPIGRWEHDERW